MTSPRLVFFDLETTGLYSARDRIVEVAAFDPTSGKSFQSLVNPGIPIPQDAVAIHNISDDMVRDVEGFAAVGARFIQFCGDDVLLVAHNGEAFDIPFLQTECRRAGLVLPSSWGVVDSLKWARMYRRDLPRHSLQYLREIFHIPANTAHRALHDVMVLYQVFSTLTDDLNSLQVLERCGTRYLVPS